LLNFLIFSIKGFAGIKRVFNLTEMTKEEFTDMVNFKLLGEDEIHINDFISYWTESDLKGKKMRFQGEKYFDIVRRFGTWKKFIKLEPKNPIQSNLEARERVLKNLGL